MAIGIIGGALAVICYLFVGIAMHRKADNVTRFLDYSVLVPRAVRGCWPAWPSCGYSCLCRCGSISR